LFFASLASFVIMLLLSPDALGEAYRLKIDNDPGTEEDAPDNPWVLLIPAPLIDGALKLGRRQLT